MGHKSSQLWDLMWLHPLSCLHHHFPFPNIHFPSPGDHETALKIACDESTDREILCLWDWSKLLAIFFLFSSFIFVPLECFSSLFIDFFSDQALQVQYFFPFISMLHSMYFRKEQIQGHVKVCLVTTPLPLCNFFPHSSVLFWIVKTVNSKFSTGLNPLTRLYSPLL